MKNIAALYTARNPVDPGPYQDVPPRGSQEPGNALNGSADIQRLRFLGCMTVRGSREHTQLSKHGAPQGPPWQHPLNGKLKRPFRFFFHQLLEALRFDATGVARVTVVDLIRSLFPRNTHFIRINHNDIVPGIHMGRIDHFVLASQTARNLAGQSSERFTIRIHEIPSLGYGRGGRGKSFERCSHGRVFDTITATLELYAKLHLVLPNGAKNGLKMLIYAV